MCVYLDVVCENFVFWLYIFGLKNIGFAEPKTVRSKLKNAIPQETIAY